MKGGGGTAPGITRRFPGVNINPFESYETALRFLSGATRGPAAEVPLMNKALERKPEGGEDGGGNEQPTGISRQQGR